MVNNGIFNWKGPVFIIAGLILILLLPAILTFLWPPLSGKNAAISIREVMLIGTNGLGIACIYLAFRQVVALQKQQQETFLQHIVKQHSLTDACGQAEKHLQEIKLEWSKLLYKRQQVSNYAAYHTVAEQVYTGGDALEKYSDDIREYGEDFFSQTAEVEYHLRYILLLIKSFITDLQDCGLPANRKKTMFKGFFFFYAAKIEFHFGHLHTETEGLAPFVQLHDEIEEVQHLIETMADLYGIPSPND